MEEIKELKEMNEIVGISSENLKKLILEIYEYRDKMSKILDYVEKTVDSIKDCYNTEDGEMFREKFNSLSSIFSIFLENIKSYGLDLEFVLTQFKENDSKSVDIFKKQ